MPKQSTEPIYVGCELIVRKGNQLLLGLRSKRRFGAHTWGLPGGHMEHGERLIETACREAQEELGVRIAPNELRLISIVDSYAPREEHHVHVTFEIRDPAWEPRNTEPEDCDELRYFPLDNLPENIFPPHREIIKNYLAGKFYTY